jgi:hypothetical protein
LGFAGASWYMKKVCKKEPVGPVQLEARALAVGIPLSGCGPRTDGV